MSEDLKTFVRDALTRGSSKEAIKGTLLEAKWPEDEIEKALDAWADVEFAVPVPRPRANLSAREAYFYLGLFSALFVAALSLGSLLFNIIEIKIPDPAQQSWRNGSLDSIRWSSSWLALSFPIFWFMARRSHRFTRTDPDRRNSKVRKWLTYLALFLASATLVGDFVTLFYNLLAGELGARLLLKVLVVAAIALAVLWYYRWDLRQDEEATGISARSALGIRPLAIAACTAVIASLVAGLWMAGSPGTTRAHRLDDQRQWDLNSIADTIESYYQETERLPVSLEELAQARSHSVRSRFDPVTQEPYEYRTTSQTQYQLCAVFERPSRPGTGRATGPRTAYRGADSFWDHGAGRTCFDINMELP